MHAHFVQSGHK